MSYLYKCRKREKRFLTDFFMPTLKTQKLKNKKPAANVCQCIKGRNHKSYSPIPFHKNIKKPPLKDWKVPCSHHLLYKYALLITITLNFVGYIIGLALNSFFS